MVLTADTTKTRTRAQNLLRRARSDATQRPQSASRVQPAEGQTLSLSDMAKAVLEREANWEQQYGVANPFFGMRDGYNTSIISRSGTEMVNYSGYNYLGLANHPSTIQAAKDAIEKYGTSASASRVASGELPLHRELEGGIAAFIGVDDALVYNSGYGTNVSTIAHLLGAGDAIFHDELIHSSGLMGSMLSGATRVPFRHNNPQHLETLFQSRRGQFKRALILIEGVYSMDGDIPDLPAFLALRDLFGAEIMVDEAHSLGVLGPTGRGLSEHFGVDPGRVDIWMGTLSKSLASCGGYIAGNASLIDYCRYTSPGFVYSCGLTPADTAAALAALRCLEAEPERVARLQNNADYFSNLATEAGLNIGKSQKTGVVPWIVGGSKTAIEIADHLNKAMINVQPIFYPTVEEGQARLRFFLSSEHSPEALHTTIDHAKMLLGKCS